MSANKANRVGRPTQDQQTRERLIQAARELFLAQEYAKVSLRKIAARAGTDPALIRYYFGTKAELFTAMMMDTLAPLHARKEALEKSTDVSRASEMLSAYYKVMSLHPEFPMLVFRTANLDDSDPDSAKLKQLFTRYINPGEMNLFHDMKKRGQLPEDMDPELMRISFLSLTIFPFIMPQHLKDLLQVDLTPEFLQRLAKHNSQLLSAALSKETSNDTQ